MPQITNSLHLCLLVEVNRPAPFLKAVLRLQVQPSSIKKTKGGYPRRRVLKTSQGKGNGGVLCQTILASCRGCKIVRE
jgi:hypothetical protein